MAPHDVHFRDEETLVEAILGRLSRGALLIKIHVRGTAIIDGIPYAWDDVVTVPLRPHSEA